MLLARFPHCSCACKCTLIATRKSSSFVYTASRSLRSAGKLALNVFPSRQSLSCLLRSLASFCRNRLASFTRSRLCDGVIMRSAGLAVATGCAAAPELGAPSKPEAACGAGAAVAAAVAPQCLSRRAWPWSCWLDFLAWFVFTAGGDLLRFPLARGYLRLARTKPGFGASCHSSGADGPAFGI